MDKFTTESTSYHSERVLEPIIIDETKSTRRIFIADINDTKVASGETVSGTIIHQRKNLKEEWEDIEAINLATLKSGEGVKLKFHSQQIKAFYDGLTKLYALSHEGVKPGAHEYVVGETNEIFSVPHDRRTIIKQLIEQHFGTEIWEALSNTNPNLATRLSMDRQLLERKARLEEFGTSLIENRDEIYWQQFLRDNKWIFGYGLQYKFLHTDFEQRPYDGVNIEGEGKQPDDFIIHSDADIKFTVLVEIKRPDSQLMARRPNSGEKIKSQNGAWLLGSALLGGVSQLQLNCNLWQRKSLVYENKKRLENQTHAINPKGILVIGMTEQLEQDPEQIETFESFRSSINKIDILTYDELFERAKFIIEAARKELEDMTD